MADLREDANTFTIPKLTRDNYPAWKVTVKTEMLRLERYKAIIGYDDPPVYEPSAAEIRRRRKQNLTALSLIMRSTGKDLMNDILDYEQASEAWAELEKQCHQNTEYGAMLKLKELTSIIKGGMSMQEYFHTIVNLNRMLRLNNLDVTDRQLAYLCLSGLPPEYEITVKTLVTQPSKMQVGIIKQVLLEQETEVNIRGESQHQALKTTKNQDKKCTSGNSSRGRFSKRKQHRYFCYACGQEGHMANACPKVKDSDDKRKKEGD
ncbi:uncharacterized protein LOC124155279 [Ischnura elegans]|uniref:uncharacterized protein LOC124155279 n=1 Tax=Ischnura elegans TaxID=197161 RepID=UPI001ED89BB7|nr:uncharacterized protein LOC124155279 [Ischnura elegans]